MTASQSQAFDQLKLPGQLRRIRTLARNALERPAEAPGIPPEQAPQSALPMEEFLRLPEILTRPLEELIAPVGKAPAGHPGPDTGPGTSDTSERSNDAGQSQRPAKHDRQDARGSALPDVFAWTNLFA